MKNFAVYNSDGKILRSGTCQDCDLELQCKDGEFLYLGKIANQKCYIENGKPVSLPDKPSDTHVFDYNSKIWVDSLTENEKKVAAMSKVRVLRNKKIQTSDWTQMPDSPLTEAQRAEWAAYRQALRDVPQNNANATSLDEVQWPLKPEA